VPLPQRGERRDPRHVADFGLRRAVRIGVRSRLWDDSDAAPRQRIAPVPDLLGHRLELLEGTLETRFVGRPLELDGRVRRCVRRPPSRCAATVRVRFVKPTERLGLSARGATPTACDSFK
jgi:hypothetical protein